MGGEFYANDSGTFSLTLRRGDGTLLGRVHAEDLDPEEEIYVDTLEGRFR